MSFYLPVHVHVHDLHNVQLKTIIYIHVHMSFYMYIIHSNSFFYDDYYYISGTKYMYILVAKSNGSLTH